MPKPMPVVKTREIGLPQLREFVKAPVKGPSPKARQIKARKVSHV